MAVLMTEDKRELIVTCDCGCNTSFHISIDDEWKDDDCYAFLCFMKANFNTEYDMNPWRAFKVKAKKIWSIMRGKDYCYSDTIMTIEDYKVFKEYVNQF